MKLLPKGATKEGAEKAEKRSELLAKSRVKRVGLARSLGTTPLEEYEETILALSDRRTKKQ